MHLQRNAYQNYILLLTNNFKFYILQILGHLNFLSVFFVFAKNQFASLNNNVTHAVCRWQAHCVNISEKSAQEGSLRLTSPQSVRPLGKTSCYSDFASNFEIISQSYYGFCYKNYFFNLNQVFRNNYDFCESFERNSNYDFEKNYNASFGKNNFGNCNFGFDFGNMIYDIGNNLAGFLFNRKINSKKILKQGEQK